MTTASTASSRHRLRPSDPAPWLFLGVVLLGVVQTVALAVPTGRTLAAVSPAALAAALVVLGQVNGADRDQVAGLRWLRALGLAQVVLALWTLQAFLRALPAGIGEPTGFYRVKLLVTTPIGDHNSVAGLLLVGVVVTTVLALADARWWAGVATTTLGIVACLSRGAAVVLLLVGALSWLLRIRRPVAVAVTAAGLAATLGVLGLAVVLDASPPPGAEVPDGPVGTSIVGRVDLAERGVEVLVAHPVLGIGVGGFGTEAEDLPPPNHHAHNSLAHAGAEGGVVLVALVAAIHVLLAVRALRQPRGWRRDVTLLGGAALVAHSQIEVLGGLVGTELLTAALLVLSAPRTGGADGRR